MLQSQMVSCVINLTSRKFIGDTWKVFLFQKHGGGKKNQYEDTFGPSKRPRKNDGLMVLRRGRNGVIAITPKITMWWQLKRFIFNPNPGEMSHFDDHIFQMG